MRLRLAAFLAALFLLAACSAQEGTNANTTEPIPGEATGAAVASGADQGGNTDDDDDDDDDGSSSASPAASGAAQGCDMAFESVSENLTVDDLGAGSDVFDEAIEACGSLDELEDTAEERLPEIDDDDLDDFIEARCEESDALSGTMVCEDAAED